MLYDRGLATSKDRQDIEAWLNNILSGKSHGCISSRICKDCCHLISDSICLCLGHFNCPNCGAENGSISIYDTY